MTEVWRRVKLKRVYRGFLFLFIHFIFNKLKSTNFSVIISDLLEKRFTILTFQVLVYGWKKLLFTKWSYYLMAARNNLSIVYNESRMSLYNESI